MGDVRSDGGGGFPARSKPTRKKGHRGGPAGTSRCRAGNVLDDDDEREVSQS